MVPIPGTGVGRAFDLLCIKVEVKKIWREKVFERFVNQRT